MLWSSKLQEPELLNFFIWKVQASTIWLPALIRKILVFTAQLLSPHCAHQDPSSWCCSSSWSFKPVIPEGQGSSGVLLDGALHRNTHKCFSCSRLGATKDWGESQAQLSLQLAMIHISIYYLSGEGYRAARYWGEGHAHSLLCWGCSPSLWKT